MITVKAFIQCSFCKDKFNSKMDPAELDMLDEAINALMLDPKHDNVLEAIDEDKGVCVCTKCFKQWLNHIESDWDYDE